MERMFFSLSCSFFTALSQHSHGIVSSKKKEGKRQEAEQIHTHMQKKKKIKKKETTKNNETKTQQCWPFSSPHSFMWMALQAFAQALQHISNPRAPEL